MGHASEDVMVAAVKTCWSNTEVTASDIRRVFYREPCLICVLAKRNKDSKNRWSKANIRRIRRRGSVIPDKTVVMEDRKRPAVVTDLHLSEDVDESEIVNSIENLPDIDIDSWGIGECISADNIGPISPASINGSTALFMFRDTKSRMIFTYPIKSANEVQYLSCLNKVLDYFESFGHKTKIIRTDYFKTFLSNLSRDQYKVRNIEHQSSTPYQHWQNAVERDVQTCKHNVSAVIHGQDLLRADTWTSAVSHWNDLHNSLPHASNLIAPNKMLQQNYKVDAHHQFRYVYGDILCFPLPDNEKRWAFDVKNEVGLYTGDEEGVKGGVLVYQPYQHSIVLRGSAHRVDVSPLQLMQWYARRREIRDAPVPFKVVEKAIIDLLKDRQTTTETSTEVEVDTNKSEPIELSEDPDYTLQLPLFVKPKMLRGRIEQQHGHKSRPQRSRRRPTRYNTVAAAFQTIIKEEIRMPQVTMVTDNSDDLLEQEARILWDYNVETMGDPIGLETPSGEMDLFMALKDDDAPEFVKALKLEIHALINETSTLQPITHMGGGYVENVHNKRIWKIATTFKAKRKKKSNGEPDKYKVRGAARGDQLTRAMRKLGVQLPPTYSPTVRPLTFAFMLQLAVLMGFSMATMDIKTAYLNVKLPDDEDWIVTQIDSRIAELCGLDPQQHYRIGTALYGLPDSGRRFYYHYKDALVEEGYKVAQSDQCLFFKITETETTYIIIYVDDTFIFSNQMSNVNEMITRISKHYTVTLDTLADSFLGINLEHMTDGTIKMTQPKLLKKLFSQHPQMENPRGNRKRKHNHPYGPTPTGEDPETSPFDRSKYLRLLGILMYLTKSRPDIMAAVSFASTKAQCPTDKDYLNLYYVVEYLRSTQEQGHILHKSHDSGLLQLYCEVDASYLLHPDSRGHTGYCMSINGTSGTFFNRSMKQQLVATSSTHAEMRAIFTLVKDIMYIIILCNEIKVGLHLPAIIMEDNSAVVTVTTDDSAFAKKCKHFLMLINYVREQVELGLVSIEKINGKLNRADIHTKPLRNGDFGIHANSILGIKTHSTEVLVGESV